MLSPFGKENVSFTMIPHITSRARPVKLTAWV